MEETKLSQRGERPDIVFPVLLIAVGVVLLLDNLGRLPGGAVSIFFNLWPVLFLLGCLNDLWKGKVLPSTIFVGVLSVLFLMHNFGYLAWNAWDILFRTWPLFFVAWGLDLILRERSLLLRLGGGLLVLALGAGLWLVDAPRPGSLLAVQSEEINIMRDEAERARIYINPSVADLQISARTDESMLVSGSIRPLKGERVVQNEYSVNNGLGYVWLRTMGNSTYHLGGGVDEGNWNLALSPGIPLDLEAALAVGQVDADLRALEIENLRSSVAVGEITIILPEFGRFDGDVDVAIGQVIIEVPAGMALRLETSTALSSVSTPEVYTHTGNFYTSPGYESAENRAEIKVSQAIGSVLVRQK